MNKKKKEKIEVHDQLKNQPYPPHPSKKDKKMEFARFMNISRQLQINIPFVEVMKEMPTYAKFMK